MRNACKKQDVFLFGSGLFLPIRTRISCNDFIWWPDWDSFKPIWNQADRWLNRVDQCDNKTRAQRIKSTLGVITFKLLVNLFHLLIALLSGTSPVGSRGQQVHLWGICLTRMQGLRVPSDSRMTS